MERHCFLDVASDWEHNALLLAVCKSQFNQALHDTTCAPETPTASGAEPTCYQEHCSHATFTAVEVCHIAVKAARPQERNLGCTLSFSAFLLPNN
jgi:hypothetical protein